jgi:two-component system response regulator AtoC
MKPEPNRILVIDDEAAMRHMLRLVLEKEGYRVFEAGDGGSGLRLLEAEPFDVVLCDIRMPEMDGMAFLATRPSTA